MRPEVKAKWVEALRSGKYSQGRNQLRTPGFPAETEPVYCCLGVLCEVYRQETGLGEWGLGEQFLGNCVLLPAEVAVWAGVKSNPAIVGRHLSAINDGEYGGHDFCAIADMIERNL